MRSAQELRSLGIINKAPKYMLRITSGHEKRKNMQDAELRGYFASIKQDNNKNEERLDRVEQWLQEIARNMANFFETHGIHESTINYHSAKLNNHESRIGKLERQIS